MSGAVKRHRRSVAEIGNSCPWMSRDNSFLPIPAAVCPHFEPGGRYSEARLLPRSRQLLREHHRGVHRRQIQDSTTAVYPLAQARLDLGTVPHISRMMAYG